MKKNITVLGIPVFFILPWAGYILSLLNLRSKISAFVYISFAAFFGYSISFTNTSADSYRYAEAFLRFERPDSYFAIIQMYLDGGLRDIYRASLFYFTSFFTNSANVLYAFAGLIYGLITYLNLRIYLQERGSHTDRYTLILALLFVTSCSLSNINGFRFNTGAMLAFYATYKIIIDNKNIWLLGLFVTPLVHYSFSLLVPVILTLKLIVPFTYNSVNVKPLVFYLFVLTFILSFFLNTNSIDISFITSSNVIPGGVSDRLDYVNSDQVSNIVDTRAEDSFFLTVSSYFNYLISFYVFALMLYMRNFIRNSSYDFKSINILFSFVLLYYSFSYIAISFPSGSRFMEIAHMFMIILLCRFYRIHKSNKIKAMILISIFPFLFKIVFINIGLPILILTPKFWYGGFVGVLLENLHSVR